MAQTVPIRSNGSRLFAVRCEYEARARQRGSIRQFADAALVALDFRFGVFPFRNRSLSTRQV